MDLSICKEAVRSAFGDFVMVNRTLVKHFGDANTALFLGYLVGEDGYLEKNNKLDQWGCFYCTSEKFEEKFGLSHKVQNRIIKTLVKAKLIEVTNRRVQGSQSISKKKHFKICYENIYNLVKYEKVAEEDLVDNLPPYMLEIQNTLMDFAKERGAVYRRSSNDRRILEIAVMHGLNPKSINQVIGEKHVRMQGKCVCAKYLLTPLIPNIEDFENQKPKEKAVYPSLRVT
jgi:hypothetical protein